MKGGSPSLRLGPGPKLWPEGKLKFQSARVGVLFLKTLCWVWWQAGQNTATFVSRPEAKENLKENLELKKENIKKLILRTYCD